MTWPIIVADNLESWGLAILPHGASISVIEFPEKYVIAIAVGFGIACVAAGVALTVLLHRLMHWIGN